MAKKMAFVLALAGLVFVCTWLVRSRSSAPEQPLSGPATTAAAGTEPAPHAGPDGSHREPPAPDAWRGRVTDDAGVGLAGIDVTVDGPLDVAEEERVPLATRSGADGGFEFAGLAPGHYALHAQPGPNVKQDLDAPLLETSLPDVSSAEPLLVTLPRGAVIRGQTLGGAHQPLAGYVVVGIGADGVHTWSSTTDAEGRFELIVPADTTWDVQVSLPPVGATSAGENTQHTQRKVRAGTKDLVLQFVPMLPTGG
ncbi:MAG: carboxypeptidase regulatory-like domain-containing protein [Planctomycetes bacterium]|nr:carboxypeptidase regulatory-like domain-containing protein [Planctomycetota bacterium]